MTTHLSCLSSKASHLPVIRSAASPSGLQRNTQQKLIIKACCCTFTPYPHFWENDKNNIYEVWKLLNCWKLLRFSQPFVLGMFWVWSVLACGWLPQDRNSAHPSVCKNKQESHLQECTYNGSRLRARHCNGINVKYMW